MTVSVCLVSNLRNKVSNNSGFYWFLYGTGKKCHILKCIPLTRKSLVKGERFVRYERRMWVALKFPSLWKPAVQNYPFPLNKCSAVKQWHLAPRDINWDIERSSLFIKSGTERAIFWPIICSLAWNQENLWGHKYVCWKLVREFKIVAFKYTMP